MTARTPIHQLQVAANLHDFIEQQVLPGTGVSSVTFWKGFDKLVQDLAPKNKATTTHVDAELATQAGPQLVVPILNARYALNAANARWGSLYDALYGTDVISEADGCAKGPGYNEKRGAKVIEYARYVLDRTVPLKKGSHIDSTGYSIVKGVLVVALKGGQTTPLIRWLQWMRTTNCWPTATGWAS
jgi:malate synthase